MLEGIFFIFIIFVRFGRGCWIKFLFEKWRFWEIVGKMIMI